jgi:hypothetical protein
MSAACDESEGQDSPAGAAAARLFGLRREAAAAFDAIRAADATLRALADRRVAAERSLTAAWLRHRTVASALEAHAQAKPGVRALLATGFAARREWRSRQTLLADAARELVVPVDTARQARTTAQADFAAALQVRAEAVAALRRLTTECIECATASEATGEDPLPSEAGNAAESTAPGAPTAPGPRPGPDGN